MSVQTIRSDSPEQTRALGAALAEKLRAGDVLALCGPLGSGKTQLVKGLAVGLGVGPDEPVVSPTFVLMREYFGRMRLLHCDAYRLGGDEEFAGLGVWDLLAEPQTVLAIEWAERVPSVLAACTVRVDMEHCGPTSRTLHVEVSDPARAAELANRLAAV